MLIVVIVVFGEEYLEKTRGADSAGLQGYSKRLLTPGKNPLCKHIWGKNSFLGPRAGDQKVHIVQDCLHFSSRRGF